jgi:hypothetical protein
MPRARAHRLSPSVACLALGLSASAGLHAEPDPCASAAKVSPCFDADPLWIPTGPTPFVGVRSAHALAPHTLSLVLATSISDRPVVLVTPSPHPQGQEIDAVRATSTVTLGGRYDIARGIEVGLVLPFVPYQTGAGTQSITAQHADALASNALRDPRLELGAVLLGRRAQEPLAIASHLALGLPLGAARAMAGAAGFTVAPGFSAELNLDPLDVALDLGVRLAPAVNLGTVREGSALTAALGVSFTLLDDPVLAVAVETSLAPHLARRPAGTPDGTLDLPAEWLASLRLVPEKDWSIVAGAGSGLPLSEVRDPGSPRTSSLAVGSPDFRLVALVRYTLPALY